MSRNVTIVVIILALVVITGYLVMLRHQLEISTPLPSPSPEASLPPLLPPAMTPSASVSAAPLATASAKVLRSASPSAKVR